MVEIFAWSAKRSGAAITITGKWRNGGDVVQSGVEVIHVVDGKIVAKTFSGATYELKL